MKKLLIASVALLVTATANAASINWSVSNIAFNGTKQANNTGITSYLLFVGNNANLGTSYTESELEAMVVSTSTSLTAENKPGTTSKGASSGAYALTADNANGDVFTVLLKFVDSGSGKTFYNLSSYTYTVSGYSDESSSLSSYTIAASNQTYSTQSGSTSTVSPGGGWTAVPEPSTAMLALAGLALLIKRRRA